MRWIQRVPVVVGVMLIVTCAAAAAAFFLPRAALNTDREELLQATQDRISDTVRGRAYYLRDEGDMVGVHDDGDVAEFVRWRTCAPLTRTRSLPSSGCAEHPQARSNWSLLETSDLGKAAQRPTRPCLLPLIRQTPRWLMRRTRQWRQQRSALRRCTSRWRFPGP